MTIANVEQAQAWDGPEGDQWVGHAEWYERSSVRHWRRLVDTGLIVPGHDVLDIGCGTGRSTREAARLASPGSVLGVDLSKRMLEYARRRSQEEGLANVRFEQADAQVHPFEEQAFEVAISSFGAMFFSNPVAAFSNIARALRPGGRLALLAWRELARNEWLCIFRATLAAGRELPEPPPGAPGPFGLADADRVRSILDQAGFEDVDLEAVDEPVEFGSDADDAFAFARTTGIVKGLTEDLDEATRAGALAQLRAALEQHDTGAGVLLGTSAWLITAARRGTG